MIRILFTYANTSELGGADFCLLKLATALSPEIFKVHLALSQKCGLEEIYQRENVKLHYVKMPRLQVTKNPFRIIEYLIKGTKSIIHLTRIIKRNHIDIVHANDLLDYYGPIAAKLSGIRSLQHVRMILPEGIMKNILTKLVLLLNDRIVAVSEGTAKSMF